ncbi:MAG: serine protease [Candidatus Electrothrix sp. AW3_4]|nr:serine protease [Candidatus Electrothrix gigas]
MADWKRAVARVYRGKRGETGSEYRGTAFMISDRWLLTCWHVVRGLETEEIHLYGAASWNAGVRRLNTVIHDERKDVALLELCVPTEQPDLVPVNREQTAAIDYKELKCGGFSSEHRDIDCFSVTASGFDGEHNLYLFPGPVGKGMSGGPVLYQGELAGISRLQDDKRTYLIPLSDFLDLLNQHVDPIAPPNPQPKRDNFSNITSEKKLLKKIKRFEKKKIEKLEEIFEIKEETKKARSDDLKQILNEILIERKNELLQIESQQKKLINNKK